MVKKIIIKGKEPKKIKEKRRKENYNKFMIVMRGRTMVERKLISIMKKNCDKEKEGEMRDEGEKEEEGRY